MAQYLTNAQLTALMPDDTRKSYEACGSQKRTTGSALYTKYGEVNYATMTPATAESLLKRGFPYLKKRSTQSTDK
jgi:hypothetical protein